MRRILTDDVALNSIKRRPEKNGRRKKKEKKKKKNTITAVKLLINKCKQNKCRL